MNGLAWIPVGVFCWLVLGLLVVSFVDSCLPYRGAILRWMKDAPSRIRPWVNWALIVGWPWILWKSVEGMARVTYYTEAIKPLLERDPEYIAKRQAVEDAEQRLAEARRDLVNYSTAFVTRKHYAEGQP